MTISEDLFGMSTRKGINVKRKGDKNERMLTKTLSKWTGKEFVRIPRSGGLRWQSRMNVCGDVICTDPDFDFPFTVETKHYKKITIDPFLRKNSIIYKFWQQTVDAAEIEGKIPLLFIKSNYMRGWVLVKKRKIGEIEHYDFIVPIFIGINIAGYNFNNIIDIPYHKFLKLILIK